MSRIENIVSIASAVMFSFPACALQLTIQWNAQYLGGVSGAGIGSNAMAAAQNAIDTANASVFPPTTFALCGISTSTPYPGYSGGLYFTAFQGGNPPPITCDTPIYGGIGPNTITPGTVTDCGGACSVNDDKNLGLPASSPTVPSPSLGPSNAISSQGQCGRDSMSVGNPINVGTGNKFQSETDYRSGGASPLEFTRTYNSALKFVRASVVNTAVVSASLGSNWRGSYDRSIITYGASPILASVIRQDGRTLYFRPIANSAVWQSDSDITDVLVSTTSPSPGYQLTLAADDSVEKYNSSGQLLSITSRTGVTQTMTYSGGHLIQVTDSFGNQLQFSYNSAGNVVRMVDPNNQTYVYGYGANGTLVSVTYPDTTTRTYVYNEASLTSGTNLPFALTGIVDENNQRFANFGYDSSGRAISTEHAGGANRYAISYGTNSSTVTDPLGTVRTQNYSSVVGVLKATNISQPCTTCGGSASQSMTYDANGNVASRTDFNGNLTCYGYDTNRNLETSRTEALSSSGTCTSPVTTPQTRTITTQWHATYHLPTLITEPGRTTAYDYYASGDVHTKTITDVATSATRIWTYTVNAFGQVLTVDGPRTDVSDVTTYTYYPVNDPSPGRRGNLATITNALGHVTTISDYDANGRPLTIVDPNGLTTTLTYFPRGWLASRTDGNETTSYTYDNAGQLTQVTQSNGSYFNFSYDAAHRLNSVSANGGRVISYTLDSMGNRLQEVDATQGNTYKTNTRVFDSLNRLQKEIGGANPSTEKTQYGYDNQGNLQTITDPLSHVTTIHYDALNRLVKVVDANQGQIQYGLNALDQLTSVIDPRSNTTTYVVDSLGNLKQQSSPDTGTTVNVFDDAGNLKTSTDARSQIATYGYDALNRVRQIAYSDQTIVFYYDQGVNGKGRLTSMIDAAGMTTWSYDSHGRVASKAQVIGTVSLATTYSYNSQGQLVGMGLPSGKQLSFYSNGFPGNDPFYRIPAIQVNGVDRIPSIIRAGFSGPPQYWLLQDMSDNGAPVNAAYDLDGRMIMQPWNMSGSELPRYLTYDSAGRIVRIDNQFQPPLGTPPIKSYTYDSLNRVTGFTTSTTSQSFSYDANSNRSSATFGSTSYSYNYPSNNNRLAHADGPLPAKNYLYDTAGNVSTDGSKNFTYDARGRMNTSTFGGVNASYKYNGLGQRVAKVTSGMPNAGTQLYVYDEQGKLIGTYDGNGNMLEEIAYMDGIPVLLLKPTTNAFTWDFFILPDHLGAPRYITENSLMYQSPQWYDRTVWRWDSDPFGIFLPESVSGGYTQNLTVNLRFPGQYFDRETNLHYNYYRDYSPEIGRYIESDPIGLSGGINTYLYVGAQPNSRGDPTGQWFLPLDVGLGIAGAAIGGVSAAVAVAQKCGSWEDIGWAALGGSLGGAASGIALGFGGTAVVGAVAGFGGDALGTYLSTGGFNFDDSATAGLLGGIGGVGGLGLMKVGVGGKLSAASTGIMTLMMTLQYNHATGAAQEGCQCKQH